MGASQVSILLARSHQTAKQLETEFRTHLAHLSAVPKHFTVTVARLNATDYVDLLPGVVTCRAERHPTAKSDSAFHEANRLYDKGRLNPGRAREIALIGFWLDASGDLRAVWIQQSSGDYWLDKLSLDIVQNSRWLPPLVGSRAAPTVDRMSWDSR